MRIALILKERVLYIQRLWLICNEWTRLCKYNFLLMLLCSTKRLRIQTNQRHSLHILTVGLIWMQTPTLLFYLSNILHYSTFSYQVHWEWEGFPLELGALMWGFVYSHKSIGEVGYWCCVRRSGKVSVPVHPNGVRWGWGQGSLCVFMALCAQKHYRLASSF